MRNLVALAVAGLLAAAPLALSAHDSHQRGIDTRRDHPPHRLVIGASGARLHDQRRAHPLDHRPVVRVEHRYRADGLLVRVEHRRLHGYTRHGHAHHRHGHDAHRRH